MKTILLALLVAAAAVHPMKFKPIQLNPDAFRDTPFSEITTKI
jgi:hypothetical protein